MHITGGSGVPAGLMWWSSAVTTALSPPHLLCLPSSVPLVLSYLTALKSRHTPLISKTSPRAAESRAEHSPWVPHSSLQEATPGTMLTNLLTLLQALS